MVTGGDFPRLGFHRGALDRENTYFGPYPSAWAVREAIQLLQKVFRLRTCEDTAFRNRSRPCLLHQIRRCTAPCVGHVSPEAYAQDVRDAELFLEGREDDVMKTLVERMQAAAERLEFEQAAVYRDQITALSRIQQRQYADTSKALDADAIACVREGGITCVNLVMVRNGRYLGDKSFFPQHAEEHAIGEVIAAFMGQHYASVPVPPIVIAEANEAAELAAGLGESAQRPVQVVQRPQTERRIWLEMAERNAANALAQRAREHGTQESRVAAMREALGLPASLARIECFDVSHTQGEETVASCVVYDRFALRSSEYRRYNIVGVEPGDDYGAMRQALTRRYERVARGEAPVPDLVLIDGGRGQVNVAREVLQELGLADVALVGVAKGPERKPGMEELILADGDRALTLPPDHPGLHLIQQVRDEAHRFAITGHRNRRGKKRVTSSLESIAGIGAKRRRLLLERFGGLRGLTSASADDLAQVEGISRTLAERIYRELH
jgi:excinuclease ABC subunit C